MYESFLVNDINYGVRNLSLRMLLLNEAERAIAFRTMCTIVYILAHLAFVYIEFLCFQYRLHGIILQLSIDVVARVSRNVFYLMLFFNFQFHSQLKFGRECLKCCRNV